MNHTKLPVHIDWQLIVPVGILIFLSLITLFSVNIVFFRSQVLFCIIALIAFFFFSQVDYSALEIYGMPIYIGSLIILFFVLVLGIQSRGAVRWFDFFGFSIQFSEILKPLLTITLASFLARRSSTSAIVLLIVLSFLLPVVFLIYRQPDLGNALIYLGTVILTLIFYGFPLLWFGIGIAVIVGAIPVLWKFLHQYQRERLLTFFHLTTDPLGISYNAIQSVIAVGSGLLLGKGLGQGTQSGLRFLPERHTDFIYATVSEELGFIGGFIVIVTFLFLFYRLFTIVKKTDDVFCKIFISSSFFLLFIQFFINIGMNMGIVPIVGVTLPFVSYGGSSLVSNAIFLGIISSMSRNTSHKQVLEIG